MLAAASGCLIRAVGQDSSELLVLSACLIEPCAYRNHVIAQNDMINARSYGPDRKV